MKTKMNIKSIIFVSIICIISMFFINMSFAANTGKIIVETAKLRENPNTESKVLELASIGDKVEILEEDGEWYKVKYNNITGYIREDLIEVENVGTEAVETNKNENSEENTEEKVENNNEENNQNEAVETNATGEQEIQKGKYKIVTDTKLKIIPLISAIEIKDLKQNEEVEVIEILNDWAHITTSDGQQGWVVKEKLTSLEQKLDTKPETVQTTAEAPKQTTMYVNVQTANLREKADKTSKVIKQLALNTQLTVISEENDWYNVDYNGQKGYISKSLLSTTKQETSRSSRTERTSNNNITQTSEKKTETKTEQTAPAVSNTTSAQGSSVVSYAQTLLGSKYVYGGTSTSGFDCSGFTQYVYKQFGVSLNRTAAAQYSNGTPVTELQAGDLVMFGKSGINHVGIYVGGNTFIHAANKSRGVTTDTLSSGYYKTNYVGARRIF